MESPPTFRISFLDQAGNSLDGPVEWISALVEIDVNPQDWERVRLILQIDEELPLSLRRVRGKVRVIATWPPSATGHFRLTLYFDDQRLEERIITIQPRKINPAAYSRLLEDLEMRLPATIALGLQRNGVLVGIKIRPPGESTLAMELARLRRAINGGSERMGLVQILNNLTVDPHKILHTTEQWVPRERARRPHPSDLAQAMSRPYNLDKHGIPERLLDTRVEHSVDVYENRLVKAYVRLVDLHMSRLSHILENRSTDTLSEEILKLRDILSIARRNATFLNDVTLPSYLPTQSTMVLLKRPAYLAALQGYLEFHKSPQIYLEEPLLETPLANLPFLYQIWCTLEVLQVLLDISGT